MSTTLLVDTNRASYPTYLALKALGHDVWVAGARPTEPLARLCPNYAQVDYSDLSLLEDLIDREGFDHLVPGCTDLSYKVCSAVSRGRFSGLDSPEVTETLNDKGCFRRLAGEIGLRIPRVVERCEALDLPAVIIKPVDSFSGRGMSILRDPSAQDLERACAAAGEASRGGRFLIEEFFEGQLFSHSAFVRSESVVADFIVREDCSTNPFTVDTSRVDDAFPSSMRSSLQDDVARIASHLGLVDGLVHTQFIVREGDYRLIEVTRRCPGDLYALLIEMSTGYPYGAAYAAPFVGEEAPSLDAVTHSTRIIRHTATSRTGESLWGFHFRRPVDLRLFVPLATTGETIQASPYGRAGLFFLAAVSDIERDELYSELLAGRLYSMN